MPDRATRLTSTDLSEEASPRRGGEVERWRGEENDYRGHGVAPRTPTCSTTSTCAQMPVNTRSASVPHDRERYPRPTYASVGRLHQLFTLQASAYVDGLDAISPVRGPLAEVAARLHFGVYARWCRVLAPLRAVLARVLAIRPA